jgi:selenoprotein W-related protein
MNVEIEYCVPCGHLDRAIRTQKDLLETYGHRLDTVTLRTGSGGVFVIRIDGEQVWDARTDGYDLDAIRDLVDHRRVA